MTVIETALRRDRMMVLGAVALVSVLASVYTVFGVGMSDNALEMTRFGFAWSDPARESGATPGPQPTSGWSPVHGAMMLAMWWVMMIAMMLPGAAPTVLLAAALNRRSEPAHPPYGSTAHFVTGYLSVWFAFSLVAVVAQESLRLTGLLTPMLESNSATLTGSMLIAAGAWQLSPLKQTCLRHCRTPADFLTRRRRRGNLGAMIMGIEHGAFCLGCCWLLMGLLFAGGVMNLYWIVGLALYVLVEKAAPGGMWVSRMTGAALIGAGAMIL